MLKLSRFLKPYLLLIFVTIGLLFVQANADLALPDYLSRIVNVGIQQGGVENAIPGAIRKSELERVLLFLTTSEQNLVRDSYTLVEQGSADYASYLKQYPVLANEPVYVLKDLPQDRIDELNPVMARGMLTVSFLQQAQSDPAKAAAMAQSMGLDLSNIPQGKDIFALLNQMPDAQREKMIASIQERFDSLGESIIGQMAVPAVKAEYSALGMDTSSLQSSYILKTGVFMLLLTLLSVTATVLVGFLSARVAAGLARDLRNAVFVRVGEFSSSEMEKFSTASLITRSTNDVTQLQMVTMMIMRMVFYAPIIGVGGIIRALGKASSMWWIIALVVVVLLSLILSIFAIALPKFKRIQSLIDRLNRVVRENLSGMMVVRAFNRQQFEESRFDLANIDLTNTMLFISRIMVIMMPLMMFIMNGVTLLIIWVGAHHVALGQMQVGDMMAFMQYAVQIFFAFMFMSFMFIILPRASVSADRIAEVLDTQPSIQDPVQPVKFPEPFRGEVRFNQVCFRYADAEECMIQDIDFVARPGETTAFIGTTGSGKSTIVNLIPRFFDVSSGSIAIDGVDIRQVNQSDLRSRIGYVPQFSNLFSGTIESNLLYGDENATEEELLLAAEIAQATEFITARPEGLQAEVSQGGTNLSGGQRQRMAIARALVKRAPIYIFDDSFSAVDFKTDSALRRALKKNLGSSTVFMVTQRVATIKNAEQIIVLDEGRIIGKGTHQELMQTCEVYRDIALSQLSQEELG